MNLTLNKVMKAGTNLNDTLDPTSESLIWDNVKYSNRSGKCDEAKQAFS